MLSSFFCALIRPLPSNLSATCGTVITCANVGGSRSNRNEIECCDASPYIPPQIANFRTNSVIQHKHYVTNSMKIISRLSDSFRYYSCLDLTTSW